MSLGMGLKLGMALKFYTSVAKGLNLKVRKFWELTSTFVEVPGQKLVGGFICSTILNRVKTQEKKPFETNIWMILDFCEIGCGFSAIRNFSRCINKTKRPRKGKHLLTITIITLQNYLKKV